VSAGALKVEGLTAGYAGSTVVSELSIDVQPGEIVALLGRNGVGKSTAVAAIAGTLPASGGTVRLGEADATLRTAAERFRLGLRTMRQDRPVVGVLTVQENLALVGAPVAIAIETFPFLAEKLSQLAGTLSGGEQKMLALARQAANPGDVWILDEPTEGLQPSNVDRCSAIIRDAAGRGSAVLLVEQHLAMALATADRWYLVEKGAVKLSGRVDKTTFDVVSRELAV
jgi:ABC-type branched-subunit amino acid transport system ATPase component